MALAQSASEAPATPYERLELLCDPGSLEPIRSQVRSRALGPRARPGDGVVAAAGRIHGRPMLCFAEDSSFAGGSLGEAHADTIVRVLELAERGRVPVVALIESAGARVQEGVSALGGYARIFRRIVRLSGVVPQISVLTGISAGGGAYSPALTDFVIMAEQASTFLTGPSVVRDALGEDVTFDELGGARVQQRNGVCHFVAPTVSDGIELARDVLSYLPQNCSDTPPSVASAPPAHPDPGVWVPAEPTRAYDVRDVIRSIVDGRDTLEVAPRWARNLVTSMCRVDGQAIGVIANQPRHLGGVLDADAAQKGARFVRMCNAYRLPILALVDTPGFLPGTKQERAAVIRHGAKLVYAFAEATVPKISIVLRKAFGGAYITMNAKDLGADFAFGWPGAEIGIMAARQAVRIVNRRELDGAHDGMVSELAERYAEGHMSVDVALRDGFLDELVEPSETRARLIAALATLSAFPHEHSAPANNIPL
jgi:acetyl-CoA carboxylase carboxyltransferase component